jgi:hypothetical protein
VKDVKNIDMTPDYVEEIKKALERHITIKAKENKEPLEVLRKDMDQLKLEDEIAIDPIECLKEWLEQVLEKDAEVKEMLEKYAKVKEVLEKDVEVKEECHWVDIKRTLISKVLLN